MSFLNVYQILYALLSLGGGLAMVLGYFHCRAILLIWIMVQHGPAVLAVRAGGAV